MHNSLVLRIPVLLLVASFAVILPDGKYVFWVGCLGLFVLLCYELLVLDGYLRLDIGFMIGFLMIVGSEGIFFADFIKDTIGASYFLVASKTLVCGALALLCGFYATFRFERTPKFKIGLNHAMGARKMILCYLWILAVLFSLVYIPYILYGFTIGRKAGFSAYNQLFNSIFPLGIGVLLGNLGMNGGLILPSIIAYYLRFVKRARYPFLISFLCALPCFIGLLGSGTRSRLFLAVVGFAICHLSGRKLNFVKAVKIGLIGGAVFCLAMIMLDARRSGWKEISVTRIFTNSEKYALFFNENVVSTMTKIADLGRIPDNRIGHYTSFYVIFWVPRVFWYDKPVVLENEWWKIYEPEIRRSSKYAGSASFAGPFFADFGPFGAVVILFVLGLCFGRLGIFHYKRMVAPGDPFTPFAAVLFPSSVFFARQVGTIYFWCVGMFILCFILYWVVKTSSRIPPNRVHQGYRRRNRSH